jgi:uncharacterized membrane protein
MGNQPVFTNDAIVFGLLLLALGFIFYTSSIKKGFWKKFYSIVPALFLAYMLPAVMTTFGLISPHWETINEAGEVVKHESDLWPVAKYYFLPAALVLMSLSLDLKAVFNLGPKALIMFFTGTVGIIIGGPVALLIVSSVHPEVLGGAGPDEVWRGLATLAGSWIGGGANQTAMLDIYGYNIEKYAGMIIVDIVVANIWMALLLIGIGKNKAIDKWLKADTSAIESLKKKVTEFSKSVERIPTQTDYILLAAIAFVTVGVAHFFSGHLSQLFETWLGGFENPAIGNYLDFTTSKLFWVISISTFLAILMSFTRIKKYEGAGASKLAGMFIYLLVVIIGMKMDLRQISEIPSLFAIGLIWMFIHALLLIVVAKIIRAPYFFLAVGSQANVGGAASAPIVASAFHPSLGTVGVLLAVFGYVIGTLGAIGTAELMHIISVMK